MWTPLDFYLCYIDSMEQQGNSEGRRVIQTRRPRSFPCHGRGTVPGVAWPARCHPCHGHTPGRCAGGRAGAAATPLRGSSLGVNPMRGKESPVFLPMKQKIFGPVTLRIAKTPPEFIPPKGGDNRAGRSGSKCETGAGGKNETGGPPPPGRERGPPPVAEQKKTAAKKAAPKKPKAEKPAVLTGTVPEWSSTGVIAQMLGFKGCRRVQQLTQDGVLETEIPPGGGARKYRTCETVQRYIAHIEQKAQETGEKSRTAELALKKLEAEVRLKESQGQLASIKADIAEGRYIETATATEQLAEFMDTFKNFAMNIPSRVAGTVASYTDAATARAIERATRKELEDMLALFVDAAVVEPEEAKR